MNHGKTADDFSLDRKRPLPRPQKAPLFQKWEELMLDFFNQRPNPMGLILVEKNGS